MAIKDDLTYWVALRSIEGVGNIAYRNLLANFGSPDRVFGATLLELEQTAGLNHKTARNIKDFRGWEQARAEIGRAGAIGRIHHNGEGPCLPGAAEEHLRLSPAPLYKRNAAGARYPCCRCRVPERKPLRTLCHGETLPGAGPSRSDHCQRPGPGIDTCAHRGALSARGRTIAVLGCGIDVIYPPENRKLHGGIIENGAVVTEYPFGTEPNRPNFPARNRIISGMSLGVLIVEAGEKSGSLITARCALEQGREVFAVPGSIDLPGSRGTNQLIRQGAKLVESVEDILEEILPQLGNAHAGLRAAKRNSEFLHLLPRHMLIGLADRRA